MSNGIECRDGAIVYWSRLGDKTDKARLRTVWGQAGIQEELRERTWRESLFRALKDVFPVGRRRKGEKNLVRPCQGTKFYTVVTERPVADSENTYSTEVTFGVDSAGVVNVESGHADWSKVQEVTRLTDEYKTYLPAESVSKGLVKWLGRHCGVGLKDNGGVYYLPSGFLDDWRVLVAGVASSAVGCVHRFCEVPMVLTERTLEDLKDTVVRRFVEEANDVADEVKGLKHEDSLDERRSRIQVMRLRMGVYRGLLSDSLEELEQAINEAEDAAATTLATVLGRDVYEGL